MKGYIKPQVVANEDLAEGVFMASGSVGGDCYTATSRITQVPPTGSGEYHIQANGRHEADHTNNKQLVTLNFNQQVTYVSSEGALHGSNSGNTIQIEYHLPQAESDILSTGDIVVSSEAGLSILGTSITDNF